MGLFSFLPYTNFQNGNVDWIMRKLKEIEDNIKDIVNTYPEFKAEVEAMLVEVNRLTDIVGTLQNKVDNQGYAIDEIHNSIRQLNTLMDNMIIAIGEINTNIETINTQIEELTEHIFNIMNSYLKVYELTTSTEYADDLNAFNKRYTVVYNGNPIISYKVVNATTIRMVTSELDLNSAKIHLVPYDIVYEPTKQIQPIGDWWLPNQFTTDLGTWWVVQETERTEWYTTYTRYFTTPSNPGADSYYNGQLDIPLHNLILQAYNSNRFLMADVISIEGLTINDALIPQIHPQQQVLAVRVKASSPYIDTKVTVKVKITTKGNL